MNPPALPPQRRRPQTQNVPSHLLSDAENQNLYSLLGRKCLTLATSVVQVYLAQDGARWMKKCTGVCCFVKDNPKRSYYIRVYNIRTKQLVFEQEIYNQFKYSTPRPYFHTFDANDCRAGLNFADDQEAEVFRKIVDEKMRAKHEKKQAKMQRPHSTMSSQRRSAPNNHAAPPPVPNSNQNLPMATIDIKSVPEEHKKDKDKKKKKKKGKLTKADISTPQNFQHVGHVGWDPNKGFDINEVDPAIKDLFHSAGITEKQMQDKETAQFIYDFIEQRGGVDAVKRDTQARHVTGPPPPARGRDQPPPPPPSRGHQAPPPPPHRIDSHGPPPAPPSRREPPPPPNRQVRQPPAQSSRLPPPPPPTNVPPPPPPPPPPVGGAPPPPPSSSSDRSGLLGQIRDGHSLKPASDRAPVESSGGGGGRGALLDQIRQGKQLKRVTEEEKCSVQESEDGGIAGALARALIMRDKVIHTDSESDSDNNDFDDDDDWED